MCCFFCLGARRSCSPLCWARPAGPPAPHESASRRLGRQLPGARRGVRAGAVSSCGSRRCTGSPGIAADGRRVVGSVVGEGLVAGLDFLGATLVMIAAWMAVCHSPLAFPGSPSWTAWVADLGWNWPPALALGRGARMPPRAASGRQARKEAMESEQKKSARGRHRASNRRCRCSRKSARVEAETSGTAVRPAEGERAAATETAG